MANFFTQVLSGEVQGGTTAAQLPDIPCAAVNIKALADNSGNVYIGGENVTKPDGITDETSGFELDAGQETGWIEVANLNWLWMITDNNGDDITYMVLK
jgi:hypothetical protein